MSHRALSTQQFPEAGIHANPAGPVRPYFPGQNKPGKTSQGKFFTDPKPEDSARYPRGYTPERMKEVRGMAIDYMEAAPSSAQLVTREKMRRSPSKKMRAEGYKPQGAFTGPAGTRHAQEVIARSTTPAGEIHEMRSMNPDAAPPRLTVGTGIPTPGAYGEYRRWNMAGYGEIRIDPHRTQGTKREMRQSEEHQGQTLIHELGHVRSQLEGTSPDNAPLGETRAETRGREEGIADANRAERWRPDPRDVRAGRSQKAESAYTNPHTWERLEGAGSLTSTNTPLGYTAYMKQRPDVMVGKIRQAARTQERGLHPMLHNEQFTRGEWYK